jgi:hypothetical protein
MPSNNISCHYALTVLPNSKAQNPDLVFTSGLWLRRDEEVCLSNNISCLHVLTVLKAKGPDSKAQSPDVAYRTSWGDRDEKVCLAIIFPINMR